MAVQRSYKYYKTYLQQQQPQQHVTTNKINNNNINDNDEIDAIFPPRKFIISGPSGVGKTYYIEKIICKECKFYRTIKIHGSDLFKFTDIGDGETYMLDAFTSSINSDNNINKFTNNNNQSSILNVIIFENIETIFGTPYKILESNGKIETSMSIRRYLSLFKQLLYTLPTNTFFICTTSYDVERLEPEIFGYQLIENVINIPLPNQMKRYEILNELLFAVATTKKKDTHHIKCDVQVLKQVSEEINGYTPADILQLHREVIMNKLMNMKILSTQVLSIEFQLIYNDFKQCLNKNKASFTRNNTSFIRKEVEENGKDQTNYIGFPDTIIHKINAFIILPILKPYKYLIRGIQPPRGAILHGKPGNGKSFISQLIGNELNGKCNVMHINCTSLLSKIVGETEYKINNIFQQARAVSIYI